MDNQAINAGADALNNVGENPAPELSIQDLVNIRAVLDAVTQRGVFRASEMAAVGTLYNKLDSFLNAANSSASADANKAAE